MYYAYVAKSVDHDYYYKGHCKNIDIRIKEHNKGYTISLKPYLPVIIVYSEEFATEAEAILRERYLKSSAGRRFLKGKLNLE